MARKYSKSASKDVEGAMRKRQEGQRVGAGWPEVSPLILVGYPTARPGVNLAGSESVVA
jgi:hypothetical protein